jgi:hypothetical protein
MAARRNGADVCADERIPFGTLAEMDLAPGLVVHPRFKKPVDLAALRQTLQQRATIAECEKLVEAVR